MEDASAAMERNRMFRLLERLDADDFHLDEYDSPPLPEGRFLGIVGLRLDEPVWDAVSALRLQPINPRVGQHEVARVLRDSASAIIIGRYCRHVSYELAVAPELAVGREAIALAESYVSLLRVKTLAEILVPAALPCSWSAAVINRLPERSCDAELMEDVPNQIQLEDPRVISQGELNWIFENLSVFTLLKSTSAPFALAVESLSQHTQQHSLRMSAAMLWSGVEALFNIKGELTHRLSTYIACLLEPPCEARIILFKEVKANYNIRSRIVHGELNNDGQIRDHIIWTRRILSNLICSIIENQGIFSSDALDTLVLGSDRNLVQINKVVGQ